MDPVTLGIMVGSQVLKAGADIYATNKANKRSEEMMKRISETSDIMKSKYEEIFDIADYFKPGGAAFKDAVTQSADVAFTTARKGREDLLAKGIDMTSYGTGVQTDVVAEKFTSELMDRKKDLTAMGSNWASVGTGLMGDWADMLSTGYKGELDASLESMKQGSGGFGDLMDLFADPDVAGKIAGML